LRRYINSGLYNNAWDEYAQDEERAHKVAWGAVKKKYEKDESSGQ
jgi:cation transport regulator